MTQQQDRELLARLDERLKALQDRFDALEDDVSSKTQENKDALHDYVTHNEFTPVKLLTYGVAGLILSTIISATLLQGLILPIFEDQNQQQQQSLPTPTNQP